MLVHGVPVPDVVLPALLPAPAVSVLELVVFDSIAYSGIQHQVKTTAPVHPKALSGARACTPSCQFVTAVPDVPDVPPQAERFELLRSILCAWLLVRERLVHERVVELGRLPSALP